MNVIPLVIDSREHKPFAFPRTLTYYAHPRLVHPTIMQVRATRRQMRTGDYGIDGHFRTVLIEKKAGINELYDNFCGPSRARVLRQFDRLASETAHPILVLDVDPCPFFRSSYTPPKPTAGDTPKTRPVTAAALFGELARHCAARKIQLLWTVPSRSLSTRLAQGEMLLHLMLSYIVRRDLPLRRAPSPLPPPSST